MMQIFANIGRAFLRKMFSHDSKRGAASELAPMLVATLVVITILIIFVLGSGIVKKVDNVRGGVSVSGGDDFNLRDYKTFIKLRLLSMGGKDVEEFSNNDSQLEFKMEEEVLGKVRLVLLKLKQ